MIRSTIRMIIEKLTMYHEKEITEITTGVTVIDVSDATVILINNGESTASDNIAGLSAPEFENNQPGNVVRPASLYIMCSDDSSVRLDGTVSGSAEINLNGNSTLDLDNSLQQTAHFMYNPRGDGTPGWDLISTTGTLNA